MQTENFSSLEATFFTYFNKGFKTFESLKANVPFNEKILNTIIETMQAKNLIKFNTKSKEYEYDSPVQGDKVILDGNIMLPVSIIRMADCILISRGEWYKFPLDFDTRCIIWNVKLPTKSKSTLVDLVKESVLKVKKSRIVQIPEYAKLVNLIIPYSPNVVLKINAVGEEITDVSMIFQVRLLLDKNDPTSFVNFRDFSVRSEISTDQLITELKKPTAEKNFKNITLNRLFNFSDFIFSNNSIPFMNDGESVNFAKITGIKGKLELTYFRFDNSGTTKKLDVEDFADVSEGVEKLRQMFTGYAESLISDNDMLVEMTD